MDEAIKAAEQARPGNTVEVNLWKDDGRVVCKIEIIDGRNTYQVYMDAMTGKVHEIKERNSFPIQPARGNADSLSTVNG